MKWEALNSEMTDDAENYLGYIKYGDEAKRDAYVSKFDASEQESIKQGLEQQRRDYERFPADYKDAPEKKLTPEQLNLFGIIKELEEKAELWEKTKEKATKMLWWEDVVEGLAKQSQQTEQSDTETEKDKTEDSSKQQTETSSTPATLSQNGEVWFMHPVAMVDYYMEGKKTETWDKVTNSRIALLHPKIRQHTLDFINDAESKLNLKLRVSDGYRSIEEQNKLYDKGRVNSDPIVTKVKGGYSFHNYGLAIDVVEILDNKAIFLDDKHRKIKEIVDIAKSYGFLWGGDWITFKDYPHFEITFGYKASELLKKYNEGELDDEGYVNIS
ncbi:M15 family metallopeptidase [Gilliamella sp. B2969]|uniref:M15 family metallopeptidase n=1 Tax=Gilliamella sp. B2969 TaxID=2818021 RepID=UPI00226A03FB|nr:M15 family metallopeptidase [Gilliamella sp. B2969]MCX8730010.1 M15 family metallopeptidase [Gilliamella sp. B2969]